ncbi:glycoside hydrolase family 3 protein [Congregibacter variabilis]|uniref:Glycoside hydrolase family 3 protein n=1 Tax=Congregibacter variabilis TaxID=3081200 RepID=A0ABZ0I7W5_9GAMM|nr:glycoside hydrolase family 3 protein [Congregibacter sp. IMCC43200]
MNNKLKDPNLAAKVEELLSQMSLEQKIGQMTQPERMACTPEDVKEFHIGSVLSGGGSCPGDNHPGDWVNMNDAYWMASMEADGEHLAIPLLYGVDAIHGNGNVRGATVFPHNIGLGAARDPDLIKRIAQATAKEILATGVDWTFAPTLAVARDIHWGRTYESYSEDPGLVGSYAAPFIDGMQGDMGDDAVVACVKHWVGDGGTTHGIDQGETTVSLEELQSTHIAPYRPAIDQGVLTVMASFNSWNGDKCHGHRQLLTDILKGELGFDGFVISDWDGIDYLSKSYYDAVGMSVNAGIDMFMVSVDWRQLIRHLVTHVEKGTVPLSRIDDAVRRILRVKFAFGLFDKPRPLDRRWSNDTVFGGTETRDVAREAVRKSLVLLKNDQATLPLKRDARILVAGKSAHNRGHQCGGFTIAWQGVEDNDSIEGGCSVWEGIQSVAPNAALSEDPFAGDADPAKHDIAVVVIGERPYAEGMGDVRPGDNVIVEAGSQIRGEMKVLEPYGRTLEHAAAHPEDLAIISAIAAKGIPVVAVLISGRPLPVGPEIAAAQAFVAAWLPGSEGNGVADVLFGDYDFQGRLSFAWPADAASINDSSTAPLFPLGFGLQMNG